MLKKKHEGEADEAAGTPHYHGHRDRLRGRFREAGADALSDYELIELLLFRALPRRDVKPLAKTLLETFGSFAEVIAAPEARLAKIKGLGEAGITELKVVQAAASRMLRGAVKKRPVLSSWSAVLDYCRTAQAFADREQFRVLFLDKRNQLIADEVQQTGTVDHTPVYPREVVKRALELSATAVILVHNHPSGRPDAVAGRHPDDATDRRGGDPARYCGARSHHRRQGRACEPEGVEAGLSCPRQRPRGSNTRHLLGRRCRISLFVNLGYSPSL